MRISIGEERSKLLEVYVTDFGDNYHRTEDEPSTELERAVRKIRRRYKNITDYMDALAVYKEYMGLLALKHGGGQLFKIKLQNDVIDDFIPPKPRMKNTAHNKMLLKNKIMISRVNVNKIDEDRLEEVLDANEDEYLTADGIIADMETKDYIAHKLMKQEDLTRVRVSKVKSISSIDFLEEYFRNKNASKVKEKQEELKQVSLSSIISGEYDDLVEDTEEEDDVVFYRGNYMNRKAVDDLKVYQDLGALGWNSVKIMKEKGVSKRITKIVKSQTKKNKKANKKKGKKRKDNDDFLVSVMMENDHDSFDAFEEDMLNFTAKNVFGR
jgi:hypothetical protein